MWNSTKLSPPPVNTFKAKKVGIDLKAVTSILENAINTLKSKEHLQTESPILSRCVYRMKLKFRQDKGFRFMEKTNKLLKELLHFDITCDLNCFLNSMPQKYEKDLYLPTKQMIEFVLVRIQGYAKLLCRVVESSAATAEYMKWRLNLGHFWTTAAVIIAIISRIWYLCKYYVKECCHWYNDLLPLRDMFEINGLKWLSDDYEFPQDLAKWLEVDWLHEDLNIVPKVQIDLPVFNLMDESDDEDIKFCYQYNLNDCFVIDDNDGDSDIEFIANFKNTKKRNVLKGTADTLEDDSDIEIIHANLNNKSHDDNDFGEIVARDSSVTCLDDRQLDNNQNNATCSQININSKCVNTLNSSSTKRKWSIISNDRVGENQNDDIGQSVLRENCAIYLDDSESVCEVTDESSSETNEKYDSVNILQKSKHKKKTPKKKIQANNDNCESNNIPSLQSQLNIINVQDLNNFLNNECKNRRTILGKSVTKNLNEIEWNLLLNKLSTVRTHAEKKPKLRKKLMKQARKMLLASIKRNV